MVGRILASPARPIRPAGRLRRVRVQGIVLGLLAFVGLMVVLSAVPVTPAATPSNHTQPFAPAIVPAPHAAASVSPIGPGLALGISSSPRTICAFHVATCAAGAATSRVTLGATATGAGVVSWPSVQVAFVIETTLYDGVYDSYAGDFGTDPCAANGGRPCEESNGVPFFVSHAQVIADSIQAANPHSQVSFALVDFFNTCNFDDCDGYEYHVDIQSFVTAVSFGGAVQSTFQAQVLNGGYTIPDSDFADNFLHSSSITALYGTITGSGLSWSNTTHHVIVWMGSAAPRDPSYVVSYSPSPSSYAATCSTRTGGCLGETCEPAYNFAAGQSSPSCEGWVKSRDGNTLHSIAGLAKGAPECTNSVGGSCTIDMIDLWATPTDPMSKGWGQMDTGTSPWVQADVNAVLRAGCDLAAATGGTWNGPAFYTCPDGTMGGLDYVPIGGGATPNLWNPTLYNAFRQIGFGPVVQTQAVSYGGRPMFTYVPFGNIALAPDLQASAACVRGAGLLPTCASQPQVLHSGSLTYLAWNFSTNASSNVMYVGDSWTASFNVMATGPPYATVPADACTLITCRAGGSSSVNGDYTWATYVPYSNNSIVTQSFPLAQLTVEYTTLPGAGTGLPPAPSPTPPSFPTPTVTPVVVQPLGVASSLAVGNVSLQATAAGFLGAGFVKVSMKNRPMGVKIASRSGARGTKFAEDPGGSMGPGVGRFE